MERPLAAPRHVTDTELLTPINESKPATEEELGAISPLQHPQFGSKLTFSSTLPGIPASKSNHNINVIIIKC